MKKTYFKAIATLKDETHKWTVTICSNCKTIDEALSAMEKFLSHGYNVTKTEIIEDATLARIKSGKGLPKI